MALTFTCEPDVIESALEKLKADGLVSKEASFNYEAVGGLRNEVAYRDFDFLTRLSRSAEVETVSSILAWLKGNGVVPDDAQYDRETFNAFKTEVKENFTIPGTSITPVMEQLLYMLSSVKRPQRVIGIGTYCGYALVWAVGAGCGRERLYVPEKVYGIDIDQGVTEKARSNFSKLANSKHIELIAEDGLKAADRLGGPFDYVYLDVESKDLGKGLYLELLKRLYEKIAKGGWILAHDTVAPPFAHQLDGYLEHARDPNNYDESISFDVDPFGLELTIK